MIDARELRCGNWLIHSGFGDMQVNEINLYGKDGKPKINGWDEEDFEPKPLDTELLELCGFEKDSANLWNLDKISINLPGVNGYEKGRLYFNSWFIMEPPKYFHILQNFIQITTGKELPITAINQLNSRRFMHGLVIKTKINSLLKKKDELAKRHREIANQLSALNISRAQLKKGKANIIDISEASLHLRESLPIEQKNIEREISEIRNELRDLHREQDASNLIGLKKVIGEIFTKEQITEIFEEIERRQAGEHPCKIRFNFDRGIQAIMDIDEYKKQYLDELNKMQEIRLTLTRIIESGCKEFGEEKFMKIISPLNRMVIPVNEINKKKMALSKRDFSIPVNQ